MAPDFSTDHTRPNPNWPADSWCGPVLVVRLSSLGDVVLSTSVVELLHRRRPDLAIDFLTRRPFDTLIRGLAGIDQVLTDEMLPDTPKPYRLVIDLQGGHKGATASRHFAPGVERITYERASLRRRMLVLTGNRTAGPPPLVVRFARLLAGYDLPVNEIQSQLFIDPGIVAELDLRLRDFQPTQQRWALISPSASKRLKEIPSYLVADVSAALTKRGWGIITLHPEAPDRPRGFSSTTDGILSFSGDLPQVAALLSLMQVVISSDSGIGHITSAVKTPLISLFGPTVEKLGFSPLGISRVLGVDLSCRPCHIHGPALCWLRHERCWTRQDLSKIVSAVEEITSK